MLWYGMLRELHIIPDHYIMICLDMLDFWGPLCMKHNQRPPAFFLVSCPLFLTRCQFFLDLGAHILVHNNIWEFTEIGMPQTRGCPTFKKNMQMLDDFEDLHSCETAIRICIYILYVCVADVRVTGLMPALRSGSLFAPGRIAGDRIQRLEISGDHATE